jgi:hypothetical protein
MVGDIPDMVRLGSPVDGRGARHPPTVHWERTDRDDQAWVLMVLERDDQEGGVRRAPDALTSRRSAGCALGAATAAAATPAAAAPAALPAGRTTFGAA